MSGFMPQTLTIVLNPATFRKDLQGFFIEFIKLL